MHPTVALDACYGTVDIDFLAANGIGDVHFRSRVSYDEIVPAAQGSPTHARQGLLNVLADRAYDADQWVARLVLHTF